MKKISIFKDGELTNLGNFETDEQLNAWFEKHENLGTFRTKEKQIVATDIEGNETVETLPTTHTFEIKDISAEIEQAKINQEALAYLSSTDWLVVRFSETGVAIPEEVKVARTEARERIVR